jgi:nitrile hydratase accessory protein
LSRPDIAAAFSSLPRLPRDDHGPVFAEPWQAQVFAVAVRLVADGHYTWGEWATALAAQLDAAARRGMPDDGSHYYEHWLATLEQLVEAKRLATASELVERRHAWAYAHRHTPHGEPVRLR